MSADACLCCGGRTVGNGTRSVSVLDHGPDGFLRREVPVRRRRCASCGATASVGPDPSAMVGKVTQAAAEVIVSIVQAEGYDRATAVSGASRSTVARIVEAMASAALPADVPTFLRVTRADPRGLAVVVDALRSIPLAAFRDVSDPELASWWRGASAVVLPDREFLPVLKGACPPGIRLCMHRDAFRRAVKALIPRCARRMARIEGAPSDRNVLLLSRPIGGLTLEEEEALAEACPSGSVGYGFLVRHHALLRTHDVRSLPEARSRLDAWLTGCDGRWARVFAPVVEFLRSHEAEVLSHPAALVPLPALALPPAAEPAALYSVRLAHDRLGSKPPADRVPALGGEIEPAEGISGLVA